MSTPHRARGSFDVKLVPIAPAHESEPAPYGRYALDKRFHGDLDATSQGEMLSAGSPATGAAGYVAMERVSGTLGGRAGSFALQHNGTMAKGAQQLTVIVVPGSGTGELAGLEGTMTIEIAGGQHSYELSYTLPASQTD